jgi:hypothetical protein
MMIFKFKTSEAKVIKILNGDVEIVNPLPD